MLLYSDAIKNPMSQKQGFVTASFRKHFFAWTLSATAGMYFQVSKEHVTALSDEDGDGIEQADLATLIAATPTTVPFWFYDFSDNRLNYKPVPSQTAFEMFVIANIQFRWSNLSGEDVTDLPFDPFVTSVPSLQMRVGENFNDNLGQTGSGTLGLANVDALFGRTDFEPDGRLTVTEKISTYGGV